MNCQCEFRSQKATPDIVSVFLLVPVVGSVAPAIPDFAIECRTLEAPKLECRGACSITERSTCQVPRQMLTGEHRARTFAIQNPNVQMTSVRVSRTAAVLSMPCTWYNGSVTVSCRPS
ncbi:hypothetical protein OH77DRAFT_176848 [Trametes cingulata]|nr:hypothetical protein OH77DRAFT_176848 [Trametes cingulata]